MSGLRRLSAPHGGVKGGVRPYTGDVLIVEYIGTALDLVNAGVCTVEMLSAVPRSARRKRRIDDDGDQYCRHRWFGSAKGKPVERLKIMRWKPRDRALLLPGVARWLANEEESEARRERDAARWRGEQQDTDGLRERLDKFVHAVGKATGQPTTARERSVGRHQRLVTWIVSGNLVMPDWAIIKAQTELRREGKL